ncbi:alpha-amylase [Elysia marginata]|uniref:Alpha-amylase n=1 Tax=Elysia marginata TaxID=1093978 RepID=A0AAV4FB34_9GAST|nr:alpha-amylase [Elysia marginata]
MASGSLVLACLTLLLLGVSSYQVQYSPYHDPHCGGRQVIVHLFEWTWPDVAAECERYLGPKGFCGAQVNETLGLRKRGCVTFRRKSRNRDQLPGV